MICVCVAVEGLDPTYQPDSQNRRSALHAAAQRGLLEICYMLIQVSYSNNAVNEWKSKVIQLYSVIAQLLFCFFIIIIMIVITLCASLLHFQAGAKVDAQDKELRTPLLEAIINNHIEVARYLIQNGASVYHIVSLGRASPHRGNMRQVGLTSVDVCLPRRRTATPASTTPPSWGAWRL